MPTGKWYVSFLVETDTPLELQKTGLSVGVDVGIKSFLTLSDGNCVPNPRFFVTEEKALAKVQRKFSKLEKGTQERVKALKAFQRVHERISNKREDLYRK